ncbi:IS66 family insertion sequence element accessory protein TnpB [Halomonas sp.]|uniref:IS66 family insertion sequence element accessory protein TnpB n=1 Tax=Halomonas sp. TaxID=1486246 RepID=UPI00257A1A8B|nr:IS66 family insertion sequence element accessory protein TnpB [Halomonas sp.]MCJ8286364.1 IS66 family insertion sequence element accessory protein TnpB [Halomonas sp.]NQY72593.1 IS66 family insertion sequence element accessory protein TnpB [Halomonas sp.]
MIRPDIDVRVYLCREPVDMRKQIDGLSLLVQEAMDLNPFDEAVFVFTNRQRDKVKILFWERNGFVVWYKRLERERFKWLDKMDGERITVTGQELNLLLDGVDIAAMRPHRTLHFRSVG